MTPPRGLEIETTPTETRAVLHAPWQPEFSAFLKVHPVDSIELNQGKGWGGQDVAFLEEFPHLRGLDLLHLRIQNIESIHALHELRHLHFETYCRTPIRFSEFPALEICGFDWGRRKADSLSGCRTLKHLTLGHLPGGDLAKLSQLTNLESLELACSPTRTPAGVESLKSLQSLSFRGLRQLTSIDGVEHLQNLEFFELQSCRKVRSLERLSHLTRLKVLFFYEGGDIESLKPIEALKDLEEVVFYGSTRIVDGDMGPLLHLPRLRNLAFMNRRHYSHRCEEFEAYHLPRRSD